MDMKTHSDKLWDLYKERRDSGLPVSLTVSFSNGTESFYYSSNPLNLVQQIDKSNVAASEDVEDMEDVHEFRKTLAQPRQLQPCPPTLLSREHRRRCLRHALRRELDTPARHQMFHSL